MIRRLFWWLSVLHNFTKHLFRMNDVRNTRRCSKLRYYAKIRCILPHSSVFSPYNEFEYMLFVVNGIEFDVRIYINFKIENINEEKWRKKFFATFFQIFHRLEFSLWHLIVEFPHICSIQRRRVADGCIFWENQGQVNETTKLIRTTVSHFIGVTGSWLTEKI